ncbi:uncharacterized protein N7483_009564 [Penicillium malachiteum]|uniref:uncharacterized protein n=1 Tax=Penicillium malachiteum TaxID=1324776 RepID=UPI0025470E94|nr:uncharacterized protein N7483_009564 [Penicillium malachiteum]KAJ5721630.1 hypothetical protein N7483_009564 [Penicillium malachiteum]
MAPLMYEDPDVLAEQASGPACTFSSCKLEPIAVVGYSYRFPGEAVNDGDFWQMLIDKRCAMTEFPSNRINVSGWCHPDKRRRGQFTARGGCFLKEDVSLFDAAFFSLSSDEAAALDPQQRHLLEVTYAALENAGIPMEKMAGSQTSVHVGCFGSDYRLMCLKDIEMTADYDTVGVNMCMNANRLSWFFDWRGTSMNIDTACSSSLVAMDLACQGLLNGEAEMGIVSGTNLILSPDIMQIESNVNMLSPDSRSYSFDHRANGFCRGEGTGTLVLKRLNDALRDGDTIRAVVRSTGSNQDGLTVSGIMQPSPAAQTQLIRHTYEKAGLSLEPTRFFEAHGTGTPVGDPIECDAIGEAFRGVRSTADPLIVGALKSNIGHLEGASGIAAVIKTIMVLEKGIIPPNTNFEKPNPRIDLELLNLRLPLEAMPWPSPGLRRASVNSFGLGGSNAHVVLDDAFNFLLDHGLDGNHCTVQTPSLDSSPSPSLSMDCLPVSVPKLLTISASSKAGMKDLVKGYRSYFKGLPISDGDLPNFMDSLAHTLNARRSEMTHKSFWVASSLEDLCNVEQKIYPAQTTQDSPVLGFVFTGQGAQWAEMGRELLQYRGYRNSIERCQQALDSFGCSWSLVTELLRPRTSSRINDPELAQPANTAMQIALVDLLHEIGVRPAAVIGHSSGEIAAAYATQAISLSESMRIAYFRGVCAGELAQISQVSGAMLAIGLSAEQAQAYIDRILISNMKDDGRTCILGIACVNSPKSVTVSGESDQVDQLQSIIEADKVFARKLRVPVAYHSAQMNQIADSYRANLTGLKQQTPVKSSKGIMMVSSVTGHAVQASQLASPDYWVANLVSPVQFTKAILGVCTEPGRRIRKKLDCSHRGQPGINTLVEIGPHSALQGPIRDTLDTLTWGQDIKYCTVLRREEHAQHTFLDTIGRLYCLGVSVNMKNLNRLSDPVQKHQRLLVNLPSYPFNHSTPYWREGRVSKRIRLGNGRLDLLGKQTADWNPLEARWRHHIRLTEMPWVDDHVVKGRLIYPAAGMIVMAIEAAHEVAVDRTRRISGFEIQDVAFQRALTIPRDSEGVETNFLLRTLTENGRPQPWMEFRLCSYENDEWHENCHGRIKVDYDEPVDSILEDWLEAKNQIASACTTDLVPETLYSTLHRNGYEFGPAFQTVLKGRCNGQQATAGIKVFQWPASQYPQPHIIHPTTLDGILHFSAAALTGGNDSKMTTAVPTGIRRLWIAREGLSGPSALKIRASASMKTMHSRGHEFDIGATDEQEERVLVQLNGLQSTNVADQSDSATQESNFILPTYHIQHVPDVESMNATQVALYCAPALPQEAEPLEFFRELNFVAYKFLDDALKSLSADPATSSSIFPHIHRYTEWAQLQQNLFRSGSLPLSRPEWNDLLNDETYFETACNRLAQTNDLGSIYVHTGRNLLSILRGEQNPLQFLFTGDQMVKWYTELNNRPGSFRPWGRYLQALGRKNPTMRILEIGAGTGGTTTQMLHILSTDIGLAEKDALYGSYDYTDISSAFFEKAAKRFGQFPRMGFQMLDITQDPASQGFELASYDLIVAANALHATPELRKTMQNVCQLLKPQGKLMLYEITRPEIIRSGFIAGLMEGWWSGVDEGRLWSPALAVSEWDTVLQQSGFRGVDVTFPEYQEDECQEANIMVATAGSAVPPAQSFPVCLVVDETSPVQQSAIAQVSLGLQLRYPGSTLSVKSLQDLSLLPSIAEETLIFLVETEKPLLSDMSRETFCQIQQVTNESKSILWVTTGGGESSKRPEYGLVDGWARSLRNEKASRRICTLALDLADGFQSHHAQHIISIIDRSLLDILQTTYEPEFVEIQGQLHVPRLEHASALTEELHHASQPYESCIKPLDELPSVQLAVRSPGLLTALHWTDNDDNKALPLLSDEVLIDNKAAAISWADVLIALGKTPRTTLGLASAGYVIHAGQDSGFSPGDRVLTFGAGKFKTRVRTKAATLYPLPDDLPFPQAAGIPVTFGFMWHALIEIGRMRRGQSILIHDGAGAAGQAAIQLAQYFGVEIYSTANSDESRQLLIERYGITTDRIFDGRGTHFARGILKMTKGRGVDLVINFIEGEFQQASWTCVASYASFTQLEIVSWMNERPDMVQYALQNIFPLVQSGNLSPGKISQVKDAASIEETFRAMQDGDMIGQPVIDLTLKSSVPTELAVQVPFTLSSDATYVLAGGLGGLGRVTAQWLAAQGARNLVLLGRSGPKTQEALDLIQQLEAIGVRVYAPPCDVMDAVAVQIVMNEVSKTMPPIRGCVQGSMVLRDQLFGEMSYENWRVAVECKALGSKHLAENLPADLDFFVLLSSLSGVHGLQGQANYAAGNSFLDCFARNHVAHGRKAVSIDLGAMVDDGLLSETDGFLDQVIKYGSLAPVTRAQFLALLSLYCNPARALPTPDCAQVVVGLSSGSDGSHGDNTIIEQPFFSRLRLERAGLETVSQDTGKINPRGLFLKTTTLQEGREIVNQALMDKLVHSYRLISEDTIIDEHAPLHTYRVDSMLAVELCNWTSKEFLADLAVLEIMGGATFAMISTMVATRSQLPHPQWA